MPPKGVKCINSSAWQECVSTYPWINFQSPEKSSTNLFKVAVDVSLMFIHWMSQSSQQRTQHGLRFLVFQDGQNVFMKPD